MICPKDDWKYKISLIINDKTHDLRVISPHKINWFIASLITVTLLLTSVPAQAGKVYVYQSTDGSRLITDFQQNKPGLRLIKVYSALDLGPARYTRRAIMHPKSSDYDPLIETVARQHKLDPLLVKSVIQAESGFNRYAISRKGALGLMQLIPDTAKRFKVRDPFNPTHNIQGGSQYLRELLTRFHGDLELALAGYNAGENAVIRYDGIPPYPETQNYVRKVMNLYQLYRQQLIQHRVSYSNPRPVSQPNIAAVR